MTVKEMIAELSKYPENMEVLFDTVSIGDFRYALAEYVVKRSIEMSETPTSKPLCKSDVLVVTDSEEEL